MSSQTVAGALVSAADAKINQAVTNHKLTSGQAQAIEAKVPGYVAKLVSHEFGKRSHAGATAAA